jgi:hypothetical protein
MRLEHLCNMSHRFSHDNDIGVNEEENAPRA